MAFENVKRYPRTLLATACIPWDENYTFLEETFRSEIRALIERDVRHIYIFGTAGEGYAVSDEQFERIVQTFACAMNKPELYPMAGIISVSFDIMMKRIKIAYSYGIRDFMFALPCWGILNDGELFKFFHDVCDAFPDCRFIHYNLMRSGRILSIKEYKVLSSEIPNLAGVKYSTSDINVIHELLSSDYPLQFFLLELAYGYGSMLGECGFLVSLACSNLRRALEYFNAGLKKDYAKIVGFNAELYSIKEKLIDIAGKGKIDGAYDKMFSRIIVPDFPLRLLPPYETSSEDVFNRYYDFLKANYPQWLES